MDNALFLADSIKSFVYEPLTVRFYCQNMCFIKDMCKKVKHEEFKCNDHLELLWYSYFFKNGKDDYLLFRKFVLSFITNSNNIYFEKEFCCKGA